MKFKKLTILLALATASSAMEPELARVTGKRHKEETSLKIPIKPSHFKSVLL